MRSVTGLSTTLYGTDAGVFFAREKSFIEYCYRFERDIIEIKTETGYCFVLFWCFSEVCVVVTYRECNFIGPVAFWPVFCEVCWHYHIRKLVFCFTIVFL